MRTSVHRAPWFNPMVTVGAGLLIGLACTVFLQVSQKWTFALMVGMVLIFPALFVRPPRLYGLVGFLLLLLVEVSGKSVDKYFLDIDYLHNVYGLPPAGPAALFIWPSDVILFMLVGSWFLRVITREVEFHFPRVGYLFLAFVGWALVCSLLKSEIFYFSLVELLNYSKYFVLFLYAANMIGSPRVLKAVIFTLLGFMFFEAFVAVPVFALQAGGHPTAFLFEGIRSSSFVDEVKLPAVMEGNRTLKRAGGTFGSPHQLSAFLVFALPLALSVFWVERNVYRKMVYGGLFLLGGMTLVIAFARAPALGIAVGLTISTLFAFYRKAFGPKVLLLITSLVVTLGLLGSPLAYKFLTTRPGSFETRFPLMEKAIVMILENPVLGVGLSNHTVAKKLRFPDAHVEEAINPTHNQYLSLGSELGLVGLGLNLALFAWFVLLAMQASRLEEPYAKAFALAFMASCLSLYVQFLADNFGGNMTRSLFFLGAGIVAGLCRQAAAEGDRARAAEASVRAGVPPGRARAGVEPAE